MCKGLCFGHKLKYFEMDVFSSHILILVKKVFVHCNAMCKYMHILCGKFIDSIFKWVLV